MGKGHLLKSKKKINLQVKKHQGTEGYLRGRPQEAIQNRGLPQPHQGQKPEEAEAPATNQKIVIINQTLDIMMENDWKLAYSYNALYKAEMAKEKLMEAGIPSVIMNKKDTSYQSFGDIEIYVNEKDLEKAKEFLTKLES